jgi:hypothetical protein
MFGQIFEVFLWTILNHKLHSQLLESCVDIDPSQHIQKPTWIMDKKNAPARSTPNK